eukprot:scaffold126518_cov32-Tisochrysis_lutea.AAC.1
MQSIDHAWNTSLVHSRSTGMPRLARLPSVAGLFYPCYVLAMGVSRWFGGSLIRQPPQCNILSSRTIGIKNALIDDGDGGRRCLARPTQTSQLSAHMNMNMRRPSIRAPRQHRRRRRSVSPPPGG